MDCQTAHLLIEAFHDDELSVADAACLLAHLDECAPCREKHVECQQLRSALRERRSGDRCPEEVKRRLQACLEQRLFRSETNGATSSGFPPAPSGGRSRPRWGTAAVGAVSLGAGLLLGRFLEIKTARAPSLGRSRPLAWATGGSAGAAPRDATRGVAMDTAGATVARSVDGELFCASCELGRRYPEKRDTFSGHQAVLKTPDGHLYTVLGASCDSLLDGGHECRSVSVTARLSPDTSTAVLLSAAPRR